MCHSTLKPGCQNWKIELILRALSAGLHHILQRMLASVMVGFDAYSKYEDKNGLGLEKISYVTDV